MPSQGGAWEPGGWGVGGVPTDPTPPLSLQPLSLDPMAGLDCDGSTPHPLSPGIADICDELGP